MTSFNLVHNWFLTCLFVGIPWEEDSVGLEEWWLCTLLLGVLLSEFLALLEDFRVCVFCLPIVACEVTEDSTELHGVLEE